MARPAVGIDLGTTYSTVAHVDASGRPRALASCEGDRLVPSVVLFDGDEVVVGREAVKALATEPESVVELAKRAMGRRAIDREIGGRRYPPQVVLAWVLKKLRDDAAQQIGVFRHAVITVPAYFDEVRRKATQEAGYMAGLEVLDILNEPTAAALAFGYEQGFLSAESEAHQRQTVLVYDLGGGTFDVTVMRIEGRDFTALATDGDVQLGGRDWDQRLVDHAAAAFDAEYRLDPRRAPDAAARLWRQCEECKRTLSARAKTHVVFDWQGHVLRLEVSRDAFEHMTHDLVERTRFTTLETLRAAKLDWGRIDRVLLVGGSTRMPMIRRMLTELSGKTPEVAVEADEAVAYGAALHAERLMAESRGEPPPFRIHNVNSHSLGVVATDRNTGLARNAVIVPRNTPLPVTARRTFRTREEGQASVLVEIVEGESASIDGCTPIGSCVVKDLPLDLPAKTPIEVRFEYAANGRLGVSVQVTGTNRRLEHELERPNSLGQRELDAWRKRIAGDDAPVAE